MHNEIENHPTYSEETFAELCLRFNIADFAKPECQESLERFAEIWRWNQSQWQDIRQPGRDKIALEAVAKQATRLKNALQDLSPEAMTALENVNMRYNSQAITSDARFSKAGHEFHRYKSSDNTDSILVSDIDDLGRSITILETLAGEAIGNIRPMSAGARKDHALRLWVSNIAGMWTNTLKRKFTRDVIASGQPISEAAQFCVSAFAPVNPLISPSKIINEMKIYITKSHKDSTGNNYPKNNQ